MKTKLFAHQRDALRASEGREYFGFFMDMGTGKSLCTLAEAERLYAAGKIDAMLVIAPKGVHTNWVRREIPTHWEGDVITGVWKSGAGARHMKDLQRLLKPRELGDVVPMRVLSMNIDAVSTKAGYDFALKFLRCTKAMIVLDESSRIKNPNAVRTEQLMLLRPHARCVRILSGTPLTNAPMDVFAQFEFMESGLLGTTSYRAFVAEYAVLLDSNSHTYRNMVAKNPRVAHAQIVAKDELGRPMYRNLEKLKTLIQRHSFRVTKEQCLDLPEKVYTTLPFEISPAQRRAYERLQEDLQIELEDGEVLTVDALGRLMKLQQVTSGFVMVPGRDEPEYVSEDNPRLKALVDYVEDVHGKFIVWARFREELRAVAAALREAGIECVEYHGGVNDADRDAAIDSIQHGTARAFVGNAQSGGIGLTLTAAETVIYFSNDFNYETRKQSEDRAHRIGTKSNVLYVDLVAQDTIDEGIARSLQRKEKLAKKVLGD